MNEYEREQLLIRLDERTSRIPAIEVKIDIAMQLARDADERSKENKKSIAKLSKVYAGITAMFAVLGSILYAIKDRLSL